jgi:hypothetical protein
MTFIVEKICATLLVGVFAFMATCSQSYVKHKSGRHGHAHMRILHRRNPASMTPIDTYYPRDWREFEPDQYPVITKAKPTPTLTPLLTPKTHRPVPTEL